LTLFWYDSQGCIQADSIHIIEELPLLAVMIMIFEDFPLGMWGYTPVNIWTKDENLRKVPYRRNENAVGSFQIIGRRTFTADASNKKPKVQTATTPTTTLNTRRSRRLSKRPTQPQPSTSVDEHSEDEDKRAKELLGTESRSVTDHLPVLISSQALAYTSTEIIRRLVKSTATDGFRVQLWMLSKKLQPIHALDPKDFWKAFWHTLRCKSSFASLP
jgi:hypothetical protein